MLVRETGGPVVVTKEEIDLVEVSCQQILSASVALIPFGT